MDNRQTGWPADQRMGPALWPTRGFDPRTAEPPSDQEDEIEVFGVILSKQVQAPEKLLSKPCTCGHVYGDHYASGGKCLTFEVKPAPDGGPGCECLWFEHPR